MLKKMLASALFAGLAAGLVAFALHFALLVPIIKQAELYETGVRVHFAAAPDTQTGAQTVSAADPSLWHRDTNPLHRGIMTFGAELVTYTGLALILVALFALAERAGHMITPRQGLLWGLAGFLAFHVAPAAGLPAETPGIPAAALSARQIWWVSTVLASALGIALLAFGRKWPVWALAIVALTLPHLIGAPHLHELKGVVPPTLEGLFAGRSIAVGAAVWTTLGVLAAWVWTRQRVT